MRLRGQGPGWRRHWWPLASAAYRGGYRYVGGDGRGNDCIYLLAGCSALCIHTKYTLYIYTQKSHYRALRVHLQHHCNYMYIASGAVQTRIGGISGMGEICHGRRRWRFGTTQRSSCKRHAAPGCDHVLYVALDGSMVCFAQPSSSCCSGLPSPHPFPRPPARRPTL